MDDETTQKKQRAKPRTLPPPGGYLTSDEAADELRIRRRKMAYLLANEKIPSLKIDGRRLVRRVDLDAYASMHLNSNEGAPVAPETGGDA